MLEPTWKNKSIWSGGLTSPYPLTDEQKSRLLPLIEKNHAPKSKGVKELSKSMKVSLVVLMFYLILNNWY